MPNPRTRHSKSRTRLRRTHDHAAVPQIATCKSTGERHILHHAYKVDGDLYYRGKVLVKGQQSSQEEL
jgi:large subunit ribosomal protein L32